MPKKKCRFISKSNSCTYKLIPGNNSAQQEEAKRKEEQANAGIFFDDNYDYLQHLRTRSDNTNTHDFIRVPVTRGGGGDDPAAEDDDVGSARGLVFPFMPTTEQLKKQQTLPPDMDADLLEALEGGECGEEIEDDFVNIANHVDGEDEETRHRGGDDNDDHHYMHGDDDDDEEGDDDDDADVGGKKNDEMSEEDFKKFYDKFQSDDIDFDNDLETVGDDDDAMMKTLDLLAISSKKNVRFKEEEEDDKVVVGKAGVVGRGGGKEEKEVLTLEAVNRDVTIESLAGVSKKSKHQPKTVCIQFDKKKKKKAQELKSNG